VASPGPQRAARCGVNGHNYPEVVAFACGVKGHNFPKVALALEDATQA
jgi:hypothetical protein